MSLADEFQAEAHGREAGAPNNGRFRHSAATRGGPYLSIGGSLSPLFSFMPPRARQARHSGDGARRSRKARLPPPAIERRYMLGQEPFRFTMSSGAISPRHARCTWPLTRLPAAYFSAARGEKCLGSAGRLFSYMLHSGYAQRTSGRSSGGLRARRRADKMSGYGGECDSQGISLPGTRPSLASGSRSRRRRMADFAVMSMRLMSIGDAAGR